MRLWYFSTYPGIASAPGSDGSASAVPSRIATSPPLSSASKWSATRGFASRLRSFGRSGWL